MKAHIATAALAAGLLLPGCGSKTSGIEGRGTLSDDPKGVLVVNNAGLAKDIQVVDMQSAFAGNILKAQVSLLSKSGKDLDLQYKFAWFNAQGMEIDPDSRPWTPLLLHGQESRSLQAVAPNPAAREFKIKIRSQ